MSVHLEMNMSALVEENPNFSAFDTICGPALYLHKYFGFRLDNNFIYRITILVILHFGVVLGFVVLGMAFGDGAIDRFYIFNSTWQVIDSVCAGVTVLYFFVKRRKLIEIRKKLSSVPIALDDDIVKSNRKSAFIVCFYFTALIVAQAVNVILALSLQSPFRNLKTVSQYKQAFYALWILQALINTLCVYPIIAIYGILYISLCLVCCAYLQNYSRTIRKMETPSVEEWYLLQYQRADLTSVVSLLDNLLSPMLFLWTSLLSANIPVAYFELVSYSCSAGDIAFNVMNICGNTIHLVILLLYASKVCHESQNCIATVSRMAIKNDIEHSFCFTFALESDTPQMTAWNFFVVKKGTVLAIIGIIATYAALVYQTVNFTEREKYCEGKL